jgi:hypothetical protein
MVFPFLFALTFKKIKLMKKKLTSFKDLKILKNNSAEYKGDLPSYQQLGVKPNSKRYVNINQHRFTPYQNLLYKRAINGLNMYTRAELNDMHWEKKRRITRVSKKAQTSLNLFKQERVNVLCDSLFNNVIPRSKLGKDFLSLDKSVTDPGFINTLELEFLGITKDHIINRFVKEGILPKNFYNLKKSA